MYIYCVYIYMLVSNIKTFFNSLCKMHAYADVQSTKNNYTFTHHLIMLTREFKLQHIFPLLDVVTVYLT